MIAESVNFSFLSVFARGDFFAKSVLLILPVLSIFCWAIILAKYTAWRKIQALNASFISQFRDADSLISLFEKTRKSQEARSYAKYLFLSAMNEWQKSSMESPARRGSLTERIERLLSIRVGNAIAEFERHISLLASSASTAPFIGLFGTVWGIMKSFQDIAVAQTAGLNVIAPGIAEALLATALGLFTAIPASAFYNILSEKTAELEKSLSDFQEEILIALSRYFDEISKDSKSGKTDKKSG